MPDETKERDGGVCHNCGIGRMKDTGASWTEGDEVKVLYKCDFCDLTETRNPEPTNIDRGEGEE